MTSDFKAARPPERLMEFVVRFRARVVALVILVSLGIGSGAVFLEFNPDMRIYFSADSAERKGFEAVEHRHGVYAIAVLLVVPESGTIYDRRHIEVLRHLTAAARTISGVKQVASLTGFQPLRAIDGRAPDDPLLGPTEAVDDAALARIKAVSAGERDRTRGLVSSAGDVASVILLIDRSARDMHATLEDLDRLVAGSLAIYPGVPLYLSGDAVMDRTFIEAIMQDLVIMAPLQALLLVLFLLVCIQSVSAVAAILGVLAVACSVTMGLAGWFGVELNGVTSATPMILLGLAVATGIHVVMTWQQALRSGAGNEDKESDPAQMSGGHAALLSSVRVNFIPVALATLTTAVSFLCLNFSDSPPFRTLGNLVSFGLVLTFFLTFTLLPALMSWLPPRAAPRRELIERAMARLGAFVTAHHKLLLAGGLTIALACAWGTRQLTFDDRFSQYFSERFAFRQATDILEKRLSGLTVLEFSLPARLEGGVANPEFLRQADVFASWLRRRPETAALASPTDIIRRLVALDPTIDEHNELPATLAAGRRVLAMMRSSGTALPGRPISADGKFALISVVLREVSSDDVREFAARAENWLQRNTPSIAAQATGLPVLAAKMFQRNSKSMLVGTLVALVLISLILVLAFRSLKFGAISLLPNLLPMLIAYGLWGALFGELTFSATVVLAIAFGIVVDDTVHFMAKYDLARKGEMRLGSPEAVIQALRTVGVALVATTISIVSGFVAMAFSGFLVNQHLGLLTTFTLLAALATATLLLPAFLVLVDRDR